MLNQRRFLLFGKNGTSRVPKQNSPFTSQNRCEVSIWTRKSKNVGRIW